jgi:phosphatidylglycerol---prolipoprotein diacylglyceryl transferase
VYPELFHIGDVTIYSYGTMIAIGAITGVAYMVFEGKRAVGLSFDQANNLFLLIFLAAVIGGKFFLFLEDPSGFIEQPKKLLSGRGFVFYGSFLFAIPTMLMYFRYHKLNTLKMLDVMALTTCLVHFFGRIGCFLAGCCHGVPTDSMFGITFTDPGCYADPKGVALHPTQLYEAGATLVVTTILLWLKHKKEFNGQLFLLYLMLYAVLRFVIEFMRGDEERGFVLNLLSHAQAVAIFIMIISASIYFKLKRSRVMKTVKE